MTDTNRKRLPRPAEITPELEKSPHGILGLINALQWLLDDLTDSGEHADPATGKLYDSVEFATRALTVNSSVIKDPAFNRYDLAKLHEVARDCYESNDCEFDDPLTKYDISPFGNGVWVKAWMWVPHEKIPSLANQEDICETL